MDASEDYQVLAEWEPGDESLSPHAECSPPGQSPLGDVRSRKDSTESSQSKFPELEALSTQVYTGRVQLYFAHSGNDTVCSPW